MENKGITEPDKEFLFQKVFVADGFKCVYCGARMGKRKLVIDTYAPGEYGAGNFLTACSACYETKGNSTPQEWMDSLADSGWDFDSLSLYLKFRKLP